MPVYEYRCDACNNQFELRQKFSDPPAEQCPKCGGTVRKLVSAASFSLKGGGWYGDGYGDKAEPTKSEGDTAAGSVEGTADTGAIKEGASPNAAPAAASVDAAATSVTQASAPSQVETKSAPVETPTASKDKAEVKSQGD